MDTSIILILILVIVALTLLCISLIALYIKLTDRFTKLQNLQEKGIDPATMINQAQSRSQQILENAHIKAREIIANADTFLKREEGALTKGIDKAQEVYVKTYNEAIAATENKAAQMIQNIPQDIKITLISVIDNFRVSLSGEVKKAQEDANRTIREAYQAAAKEVDKYKEERMLQVDKAILSIVKEVTEKVLGKSITTEEHEKLVQKSLEEAKKQKVF